MAKKPPRDEPQPASVTPQQGTELLTRQIERGEKLLARIPFPEPEFTQWLIVSRDAVEKAFGKGSREVSRFIASTNLVGREARPGDDRPYLGQYLTTLRAFVEVLGDNVQLASAATSAPTWKTARPGSKVFIVHGRDNETKLNVARFLEGLLGTDEVVILHERTDRGRTVVEKFEDHAGEVGFAVVLLTPDDVGTLREDLENALPDEKLNLLQPRARQNVVLELGFFLGRLGRARVCVLRKGEVEMPSDYVGVLWKEIDSGGAWKLALAREMSEAGFPVDLSRVR